MPALSTASMLNAIPLNPANANGCSTAASVTVTGDEIAPVGIVMLRFPSLVATVPPDCEEIVPLVTCWLIIVSTGTSPIRSGKVERMTPYSQLITLVEARSESCNSVDELAAISGIYHCTDDLLCSATNEPTGTEER